MAAQVPGELVGRIEEKEQTKMTADYITLAPHLTDALWPGGVPTLELEEIFLQGAVLVALPYLDGDPVFKGHPRAVIEEDFKTKMRAALRILRADTGPVN